MVTTLPKVLSLILVTFQPGFAAGSDLSGLLTSAPESHNNLNLRRTSGTLPAWLKGVLYRAGPGLFEHGGRSVDNIVDGLAKVHGWEFAGDGTVKYSAVMISSNIYNKTIADKVLAPNQVMGKMTPDLSIYEEIELAISSFDKKDNANIAIWDLDGGKSVTVTAEIPVSQQLIPHSLTYKGIALNSAIATLGATQKALFSATHYAKHVSGSSINYVLTMNLLPWQISEATYQFFEYIPDSSGELITRKIGSISTPTTDLRLLHQFGVSENFVVVPLWNYQIYPESLDTALHDLIHLCDSLHFNYDVPLYFYVMSLTSDKQYRFELPPGRGVHIMNTFERTNRKGEVEIVMDAPTTTDVNGFDLSRNCLFDVLKIPYIKDPEYLYGSVPWNTTLRRYILNINTSEYTIEDLPRIWEPLDSLIDFPFINPAYWGREYCYCYFQQWQLSTNNMDLMKYDVCKKTYRSWHEDYKHVMEPVFVANPIPSSEDDGVVMAPVYDSQDDSTELIVWDAKDLTVLARYDNLVRVPYTLHGLWFGDKRL